MANARYDLSPSLRANQMLVLWFLLVALAAWSAKAGQQESSSSAAHLRGRMAIVNEQKAFDQRYFAHQVAVFKEGAFICGGSIISPDYILTSDLEFESSGSRLNTLVKDKSCGSSSAGVPTLLFFLCVDARRSGESSTMQECSFSSLSFLSSSSCICDSASSSSSICDTHCFYGLIPRAANESSVVLKKYHKFNTDPEAKRNFWDVGYGASDANDYSSPASKKVRVAEIWIHPKAVIDTMLTVNDSIEILYDRRSNDIAILRLVSPLTFSDSVRSISLSPDDSNLGPGDDLTVSGWGTMLAAFGPLPSKLQALTVNHRPDFCEELFDNKGYTLLVYDSLVYFSVWYDKDEMVCAGCPQLGSGVGAGDSGGALTVLPTNGGCPVEIAVVQAAYAINRTAFGMTGFDLYSRLSTNLEWIEHMVKQPLRSTVVPVPTQHCETCLGNDHPSGEDCQKAQKYDLNYCQMQARLASSFVLEEPICEGGKHKLKAHMNFAKGLAGLSPASMANATKLVKSGHVIFLVTNKGTGNGVIHISTEDGQVHQHSSQKSRVGEKTEVIAINTPLKKPKLSSKLVSFDSKEEGWLHLVSGFSSKSTYAALYILSSHSGADYAASKHAHYQISLPVGKVPLY